MGGVNVADLSEIENSSIYRRNGLGLAHRSTNYNQSTLEETSNARQTFSQGSISAYCSSDLEIPARSQKLCHLKISIKIKKFRDTMENCKVLTEPQLITIVFAARTITKINDGMCWTKIINVTSENLVIPKNTALWSLEKPYKNTQSSNLKRVNLVQNGQEEFQLTLEEKIKHLSTDESHEMRTLMT